MKIRKFCYLVGIIAVFLFNVGCNGGKKSNEVQLNEVQSNEAQLNGTWESGNLSYTFTGNNYTFMFNTQPVYNNTGTFSLDSENEKLTLKITQRMNNNYTWEPALETKVLDVRLTGDSFIINDLGRTLVFEKKPEYAQNQKESTYTDSSEVYSGGITEKKGILLVGMEIGFPPMEYYDTDGKTPIGFDVSLAKAIAKKMNLEVEFVDTAWDGIFSGIETRKYDCIISSVEITPIRKEYYNFSKPYLLDKGVIGEEESEFGICIKKGNDALTDAINNALDELYLDDTMLRISNEILGMDLVTAVRR